MTTNTIGAALIIVGGSTVLAITGLLVVVKWCPAIRRSDDDGSMGVFFSMVGVLYAVLLAFVVVIVWGDFVGAGQTSNQEVTRISNLARDAGAFPSVTRDRIRRRLVSYARAVGGPEWETMAHGDPSPAAADAYAAVWREYYALTPETDKQQIFYEESVARLNELGESRRTRLNSSQATVPAPMWGLLLLGFAVTVGWTYVFHLRSLLLHAASVGSIAALTGFVLFLIFALQHPFAGDVRVSPQPFVDVARHYGDATLAQAR